MLNYAEWVSEQAHRAIAEGDARQEVKESAAWHEVHAWPGLKNAQFKRFNFQLHLGRPVERRG